MVSVDTQPTIKEELQTDVYGLTKSLLISIRGNCQHIYLKGCDKLCFSKSNTERPNGYSQQQLN